MHVHMCSTKQPRLSGRVQRDTIGRVKKVAIDNASKMDAQGDPGDVFAIPDLWGPSPYDREVQESHSLLFPELKFDDINEKLAPSLPQARPEDGFFGLPDLSFGVLVGTSTPSTLTESSSIETASQKEDVPEGELWMQLQDEPSQRVNYLSWDAFEDLTYEEPHTAYISEAGHGMFDAALADDSDALHLGNTKHLVIKSQVYAASLLALGLGWSSLLFTWDDEKKSFVKALGPIKIPGCTGEATEGLTAMFMSCGNTIRYLELFVERIYQTHKTAGRIAMADAVSTLLSALQTRLSIPSTSLTSFLQLQALFKPAEALLTSLHLMVESVSSAESDEAMLSQLFHEVQRLEHRMDSMRDVLLEVLAHVSRPFLDFMGEWMGTQREVGVPLEKERGSGKSFVKVEDRIWIDEQGLEMRESDFIMNADMVPSFISTEDAHTMFETGRSLRFLRIHHPDHPLARGDLVLSDTTPKLEWKFSWQDTEQVKAKALRYEKDLAAAIKKFSNGPTGTELRRAGLQADQVFGHQLDIFCMHKEEIEAHVVGSIAKLNEAPSGVETNNQLSKVLKKCLSGDVEAGLDEDATFAPPISLIPILSFSPIIAAQARIVNSVSMRLFFQAHNLREHLSIQRRFQLLGDGVFSSRLSHALFDPELETAERKAGVVRGGGVVGLRLESRDNWPPATSELRLALMGVLAESYGSTTIGGRERAGGRGELPGDLSFAVRDMSEEEIEKCKDSNSIEALDFLRLSYKPPPPLEVVITPMSLYKYDQIFKLLLRLMRMLFLVSQLFRDALDGTSYWRGVDATAQRFRIEAHHFVSCVAGYFFDTGIEATWRILERKLDQIEKRVNSNVDDAALSQNEGIDKLREYHERVLDRIMFALLLRKRQQPVMRLMEDIFALILHFARHSRSGAPGVTRTITPDPAIKDMYQKFRRKVEVFLAVCKGLSEKKGYGEKRALESRGMSDGGLFDGDEVVEENTIVQLLARFEMSSYYSQSVSGLK